MAEDSTLSLYYPALVGGVRSSAPPRTLQDPAGPFIWRDALNMTTREGVAVGRPGIMNGWPYSQPPAPPSITGVETTEVVRYIGTTSRGAAGIAVVVTNRQMYTFNGTAWVNVTPTYSDGTITATNGSPSITGAGTLWNTRAIGAGYIRIDGADYLVSISTDTTATLTPNFAGATGAGKAYVITRRFDANLNIALGDVAGFDPGVWALMYNDDLYVAGPVSGGNRAVIKVSDPFGSPSPTYLTSNASLVAGLDVIPDLNHIVGLAVLQDGRVVISTIDNVVYYSSHLNTAVWTTAPGGDTPLAEVDNQLRAQGRIGATLTFHHAGGVVFGDPTGLADPPLRFQASSADMGCVCPKTLRAWEGGEAFVAADGDVKVFDGSTVRSMGDGEMRSRTGALAFGVDHYDRYHAQVLTARHEYVLARTGAGLGTKLWTFSAGSWWPGETTMDVGVLSSDAEGVGGNDPDTLAVVGCRSDSGATLRAYREDEADAVGTPTYMLETDDLDAGRPLDLKTPARAAVWPVATMDDLTVGVRRADDSTYVSAVADPLATNRPKWFDFQPGQVSGAVAADTAHRWKLSGTTLRLGVFALLVRWVGGGEKEKVTGG